MMIEPGHLQRTLCSSFCAGIEVSPTPSGLAVGSMFTDGSGDPIAFYVVDDPEGVRLEDAGDYLPHLVASGIDIERGTRAQMLDTILKAGGAYWDRDTLEIRTLGFSEDELAGRAVEFLSAMVRIRDLELITREVVRSTFKEDATSALLERLGEVASIEQNAPISRQYKEYPSDLIIRPRSGRDAAVYLVNNNDRLNEALLLLAEAQLQRDSSFLVVALIDDLKLISPTRFQRAQNRLDAMPIFRGDERAAVEAVAREVLKGAVSD